ncbi:MAG: M4 family metallopeptidase [Bacteroidota bacterium]
MVGHEFTHGINRYTAFLASEDEPGALNEGFADIFGCAVARQYTNTTPDKIWCIFQGDKILRDISGKIDCKPDNYFFDHFPHTYKGQYWYSGNGDHGGTHSNCAVLGYWFYLLSEGGSGTNDNLLRYTVTGIGHDKAIIIAFKTLTEYLTRNSGYKECCDLSILAASVKYGCTSNEVTQCINAWKAVGLGTNYTATPLTVSNFTATPQTVKSDNALIDFKNLCRYAETFSWNFGDGSAPDDSPRPCHYYSKPGEYTITLKANGKCGNTSSQKIVKVGPNYPVTAIPGNITQTSLYLCEGADEQIQLPNYNGITKAEMKPVTGQWHNFYAYKYEAKKITTVCLDLIEETASYRFLVINSDDNSGAYSNSLYLPFYETPFLKITPNIPLPAPIGKSITFTTEVLDENDVSSYQWYVNNISMVQNKIFKASKLKDGDVVKCVMTLANSKCCKHNPLESELTVHLYNPSVIPTASYEKIGQDITLKVSGLVPGGGCVSLSSDSKQMASVVLHNTILKDFTCEFWVKPNTLSSNQVYFSMSDNKGGLKLMIYQSNQQKIEVQILRQRVNAVFAPELGKWTHFALIKSKDNLLLYQNGVEVFSRTINDIAIEVNTLKIGGMGSMNTFNGSIDDFRLWNTGVLRSIRRDWMNKEVTDAHPNYANLICYMKFNTGNELKDEIPGNTVTAPNSYTATQAKYWRYLWDGQGAPTVQTYNESGSIPYAQSTQSACPVYKVKSISPMAEESEWSKEIQISDPNLEIKVKVP